MVVDIPWTRHSIGGNAGIVNESSTITPSAGQRHAGTPAAFTGDGLRRFSITQRFNTVVAFLQNKPVRNRVRPYPIESGRHVDGCPWRRSLPAFDIIVTAESTVNNKKDGMSRSQIRLISIRSWQQSHHPGRVLPMGTAYAINNGSTSDARVNGDHP